MESKKTDGRRQPTFFKMNADRWLHSSTRWELNHEQRLLWVDVLARGALFGGVIEVPALTTRGGGKPSFQLLAQQLGFEEKFIASSFKVYEKFGKVRKSYDKQEVKFYYKIVKWEEYQNPFLWGKSRKTEKKDTGDEGRNNVSPFLQRGEEKRREEKRGEQTADDGLPPLPKNLEFKVQDKFKNMRAAIRERARQAEDVEYQHKNQIHKEDIEKDVERMTRTYIELIEDYR